MWRELFVWRELFERVCSCFSDIPLHAFLRCSNVSLIEQLIEQLRFLFGNKKESWRWRSSVPAVPANGGRPGLSR